MRYARASSMVTPARNDWYTGAGVRRWKQPPDQAIHTDESDTLRAAHYVALQPAGALGLLYRLLRGISVPITRG